MDDMRTDGTRMDGGRRGWAAAWRDGGGGLAQPLASVAAVAPLAVVGGFVAGRWRTSRANTGENGVLRTCMRTRARARALNSLHAAGMAGSLYS